MALVCWVEGWRAVAASSPKLGNVLLCSPVRCVCPFCCLLLLLLAKSWAQLPPSCHQLCDWAIITDRLQYKHWCKLCVHSATDAGDRQSSPTHQPTSQPIGHTSAIFWRISSRQVESIHCCGHYCRQQQQQLICHPQPSGCFYSKRALL